MKKLLTALLLFFFGTVISVHAQNSMATYAGGSGSEIFNDVVQLSNGHIYIIGAADDLNWIAASTPRTVLSHPGIANNQGSGKFAFVLEFDSLLQQILHCYHLPAGAAEDFRFIKTSNLPGNPTGDIFLSGNTRDSNDGGYFIGKLNNNFVDGAPSGFSWIHNVYAVEGAYPKIYQPWDVGGDGRVVFATGDSHDYNWSAIYRLNPSGQREPVPNWRIHWKAGGGEFYGSAFDFPGGLTGILYSGIVFKRDANRCDLRSATAADYNLWQSDGNGGMKKGKWPLDVLFNGPCNPGQPGNSGAGPGYTGYSPSGTFTYGPSSIVIDRRNGDMYIGFNFKSVLPDGNPDFEPAVLRMNSYGDLLWWSRLYHEVQPGGSITNSSPDQYVDALAIDYSSEMLVVQARCHGNNVENLWEGDQIAANPGASGFQNNFTGSSGNIHISWLGKLLLTNGILMHSTYVAEYAEGTGGLGAAHPDPNLDGWPNPNAGWPNVNTTRLGVNMLKSTADGSVIVLGKGRRTITTANAFQKMVKPGNGGLSCWNDFIRQYNPSLSKPLYSSLVVGAWDTLTQQGGDNVRLRGMFKTAQGIIVVGQHTGTGHEMPVASVPAWGNTSYSGESAVAVYHRAANIVNPADSPVTISSSLADNSRENAVLLYPNPTDGLLHVQIQTTSTTTPFEVFNSMGQRVLRGILTLPNGHIDLRTLPHGTYWLRLDVDGGKVFPILKQ